MIRNQMKREFSNESGLIHFLIVFLLLATASTALVYVSAAFIQTMLSVFGG